MKKYIVGIIAGVALPALVFAQTGGLTQSQIDAIMGLLRSFGAEESVISNVQVSLTGGAPSPVSSANQFCYTFTRNLRVGDEDKDVDALVRVLTLEGLRPVGTSGAVADDFHEGVASAVTAFQEKYASEILTPNGLSRGNGYVGPSTRAKLNALYECRATRVIPPRFPTSTTQPSITVLSPNGGENWQTGSTQTIKWTTNNDSSFELVQIVIGNSATGIEKQLYDRVSMVGYIARNQGSFPWNIPSSILSDFSAANYPNSFYIKINGIKNDSVGGQVIVSDRSDFSFTITAPTTASAVSYESVAQLYRELLRREPETGGPEYWLGTGLTIDGIRKGIIASYEYSTKQQIGDSYRELLGRSPNDGELTYWYNKRYVEKSTLSQVREGIMASSEYQNRATVSASNVQPSITVTAPTSGQTIEGKAGTSFDVRWATQNWSPDAVTNIDLIYPDGSAVRARSGMFNTDDNHGSATVSINADQTTNRTFRVRVYAAKSGTLAAGETAYSAYFTITPAVSNQPSITVISPNGGEVWAIGSRQTVTARTEIIPSNIVPSAYLKNADTGERIEGVAFAALDSTNRTLTVTVPSTVSAGRYYVEALAWYEGQWYSDQSDGVITITAPTTSRRDALNALAAAFVGFDTAIEEIRRQFPE